jgi:mono/diheme cytochrome c family protein
MSTPEKHTPEPPEEDVFALHVASEREPIKLWLLAVIMGMMFFGGMFLLANSGGFQVDVYDANRVSWSGGGGGPAAAPDPMVLGKRVFSQYCAVCHHPNGEGVGGQFPPLVGSEWVLAQDWHGDNHLVKVVLHGLGGPVTVKGKPFNNQMAPWGKVLKDEQIAAVLTYIRNEWGNKAPPISTEFVAKVREETKDRTTPWTQKDLQAIPRVIEEAAPAGGASAEAAASPGAEPAASPAAPSAQGEAPAASPSPAAPAPNTSPAASPAPGS